MHPSLAYKSFPTREVCERMKIYNSFLVLSGQPAMNQLGIGREHCVVFLGALNDRFNAEGRLEKIQQQYLLCRCGAERSRRPLSFYQALLSHLTWKRIWVQPPTNTQRGGVITNEKKLANKKNACDCVYVCVCQRRRKKIP